MKYPIIQVMFTVLIGVLVVAGMEVKEGNNSSLRNAERFLRNGSVSRARVEVDEVIDDDLLQYNSIALQFYLGLRESREARVIPILISQTKKLTANRNLCKEEWILYRCGNAMLYEEMGRLPEAEREYKRALALEPNRPDLLNMLGWFYANEEIKLHEALKLTQRAVHLAPDNAMIVDSLGWAYYKLGDYTQAISTLQRAVELDPDEAELRYHLGAAYAGSGRKLQAIIELNKALILKPSMPEPRKLLKTLR